MWKRIKKWWHLILGVVSLPIVTLIALGRYVSSKSRVWWSESAKWRKTAVVVALSALAVWYIADEVLDYYRRNREYIRYTSYINDDLEIHHFNKGADRLYSCKTESYTIDSISWISNVPYGDSLAVFSDIYRYSPNSKRGYVNIKTGEAVVPATEYRFAWLFSDGLAAVVKEDKVGFIDREGNVVIPFKFDYAPVTEYMYDFGYMFYDGYSIMTTADGKFGLINKAGEWVVEPQYDRIEGTNDHGWRTIHNADKLGMMTNDGKIIYAPEYDAITVYDSNTIVLTKDGRRWQEDANGKVTIPFMYDSYEDLTCPIYDVRRDEYISHSTPYAAYTLDDNIGIMNIDTGEVITPAIYQGVSMVGVDRFDIYDWQSDCHYLITLSELKKQW